MYTLDKTSSSMSLEAPSLESASDLVPLHGVGVISLVSAVRACESRFLATFVFFVSAEIAQCLVGFATAFADHIADLVRQQWATITAVRCTRLSVEIQWVECWI